MNSLHCFNYAFITQGDRGKIRVNYKFDMKLCCFVCEAQPDCTARPSTHARIYPPAKVVRSGTVQPESTQTFKRAYEFVCVCVSSH
jgi:hypothetical protein